MKTAHTENLRGDRRLRDGLSRYAREIVVVLVVKTFVLVAIWQVWFSVPARPQVDSAQIAARIYSSTTVPTDARERHARP